MTKHRKNLIRDMKIFKSSIIPNTPYSQSELVALIFASLIELLEDKC